MPVPEQVRLSYSNGQMTYTEAYTSLQSLGWSDNDITEYLTFPEGTYVEPIGPPTSYGDFDGDGIPNRFDTDHYDTDGDGVPEFYDPEPDWVWPDNGNGNGGIENGGRAKILNVAGYWTIGVAQGTLFMLVPMVMVGLSVGFMQRVVKLGAKVGGE